MTKSNKHGTWPVLREYDQNHLARIALPLGGIGTGTVSLGGRGNLRDWEIMNRPAKGYTPQSQGAGPLFALYAKQEGRDAVARALEGPIELDEYEGAHGCAASNHGFPRFRNCAFKAAYPFGQVELSDDNMPLDVTLQAFNPLIPADADASGLPVAVLRYVLSNKTDKPVAVSVCGSVPNFIGADGFTRETNSFSGNPTVTGMKGNRNEYRETQNLKGVFMFSEGVDRAAEQWGTMALATTAGNDATYRTAWKNDTWGQGKLDFWDDFIADGMLDERTADDDAPMASLAVTKTIPAGGKSEITFYLTWHFPNRMTWSPAGKPDDMIGNYYTRQYHDAWDAAEKITPRLPALEGKTLQFVRAFCASDLPNAVKEAALFNTSTLRSQTCFRTPDGRFYGWEGCCDHKGCCWGSCTHVWNYEQATAFLFGDVAKGMREIEFANATNNSGHMLFRVDLPLKRIENHKNKDQFAAADGQMGCIMKMYRDWQLSGDDDALKSLWPNVRKAVEFCWIKGGWDADKDGVMEGCQHNTMDVEYYGPNPQMGSWYLGALRAAEEMARHLGDADFADKCRDLFDKGRAWIDENLFNGEYYEHIIKPAACEEDVAVGLKSHMGAADVTNPAFQLGSGCLVDQLVGQYMAHILGLGYLLDEEHVKKALASVMKYNYKDHFSDHFNNMRSFVLGNESGILMATYPRGRRPAQPFSYFNEVMTGFEYCAAAHMMYEGMRDEGLKAIESVRARYDGRKRNPFDEAECGHHYARAMASWAAVVALTGFHYSGVEHSMTFAAREGTFFWSNGYAWGNCSLASSGNEFRVELSVLHGEVTLSAFCLDGFGRHVFKKPTRIDCGRQSLSFAIDTKR